MSDKQQISKTVHEVLMAHLSKLLCIFMPQREHRILHRETEATAMLQRFAMPAPGLDTAFWHPVAGL